MIFVSSHLISLSLRGIRLLSYQTRTNQNKLAIKCSITFWDCKEPYSSIQIPYLPTIELSKKSLTIVFGPMRIKFWYYFLKEVPKICAKNDKCLGCWYCILSGLNSCVKTNSFFFFFLKKVQNHEFHNQKGKK